MSCSQIKKSKQKGSLNQIKTIVDFELSNEITLNFNFNFFLVSSSVGQMKKSETHEAANHNL